MVKLLVHLRSETGIAGDIALMSRSLARRLLSKCDESSGIELDSTGIEFVSPSFADEIFRVFANEHPQVHLEWVNANPQVEKMIRRAKSNSQL